MQIQEISADPERLDDQLLEIFISRHSSGVHVFAAPRTKFDFCELNISALDALFDMITERYDFIFFDMPTTWFGWTYQIVTAANAVLVTGVNSIPGLRQMSECVRCVRDVRSSSGPMAVIVNRCERRLVGGVARRQHVERVLGRETIFYVHDDPTVLQSINTGSPLSSTSSKLAREIAPIAAFCADLKISRRADAKAKAS